MSKLRPICVPRLCTLLALVCASVAAAAAPPTYLKIDDDTLQVTAGKPVRMRIQLPGGETWSQANVGQFQVRTFGRVQTIIPEPNTASTELIYQFDAPGYAMIILAAGPATSKGRTDSVTRTPYCSKLVVRVDPAPSKRDAAPPSLNSPGMTAKVGMKIEVCPYLDPTSLKPEAIERGADLPVRVYFEGASQGHMKVMAFGPDGTQQTRITDAKGIAHFKIHATGRWLVRYRHLVDSVTYTGDLIFDAGVVQRGAGK